MERGRGSLCRACKLYCKQSQVIKPNPTPPNKGQGSFLSIPSLSVDSSTVSSCRKKERDELSTCQQLAQPVAVHKQLQTLCVDLITHCLLTLLRRAMNALCLSFSVTGMGKGLPR